MSKKVKDRSGLFSRLSSITDDVLQKNPKLASDPKKLQEEVMQRAKEEGMRLSPILKTLLEALIQALLAALQK